MTRNEVIKMALNVWTLDIELIGICNLEAFAALVAAHEREACAKDYKNICEDIYNDAYDTGYANAKQDYGYNA